jgi:hypothetical protein
MVFYIGSEKTGTAFCVGDGAIDDELGFQKRSRRRASIIIVREFVATNSDTDAIFFGFERAIITDKITVGDFFISWDFVLMNEVNGVGAEYGIVTETLGQAAAKFIACTLGPCQTVGSI